MNRFLDISKNFGDTSILNDFMSSLYQTSQLEYFIREL